MKPWMVYLGFVMLFLQCMALPVKEEHEEDNKEDNEVFYGKKLLFGTFSPPEKLFPAKKLEGGTFYPPKTLDRPQAMGRSAESAEPRTGGDFPIKVPVPSAGPQNDEFIKWADNYKPHLDFGGCGVGLIEEYELTDYWVQYKTVMKNKCENWKFEIKVYMAKEEWQDLEEVYQTFDENQQVDNGSVIESCEEEDWGYVQVLGCTFILGTVDDFEERGLGHAEQRTAGWLNKVGQYGIRSYSYSWTYRDHASDVHSTQAAGQATESAAQMAVAPLKTN